MAKSKPDPKQILVTGCPYFTAIKFVKQIARTERSTTLHLLVMEKYLPATKAILQTLPKSAQKRIHYYSGDTTFLDLGLAGEEVLALNEKITHIFHLAHIWQFDVPHHICEEVNIRGTRNVLAFAGECPNLRHLAFFSTLFVSGKRKGVIREDEFWLGQEFKNAFEETRFAGERLARKALENGMPISFYRIGQVMGDSQSGEIYRFDGPNLFLKILLTTDKSLPFFLPGPCEGASNLVPVDYVVNACLHMIDNDKNIGRTFHITDPYPHSVRTVFEAVCSYLGRKQPTFGIPKRLYKAVFLIPGMERLAGAPKELFDYFNHRAIHNCSNTLAALKGSGITCPRFDSYFPIVIEFARDLLKKREEKREEEQAVDPFDHLRP